MDFQYITIIVVDYWTYCAYEHYVQKDEQLYKY